MYLNLLQQYLPALEDKQRQLLSAYLELLNKWNKVYNLTAITDPQAMVLNHIADSLSINSYLQGERILDVGTGAGLPGVPLAICNPEKSFVLLDSNGKKTRFLQQVKIELGLKNIDIINDRIEKYQTTDLFSSIVSRAFSDLKKFCQGCQHLLTTNGYLLAMKGVTPTSEIEVLPKNFTVTHIHELTITGLDAKRHLVEIHYSPTS